MMAVLVILIFLLLLSLLAVYVLYRIVFCYPPQKRPNAHQIPDSDLYRIHKDKMLKAIEDMERTSCEEVSIFSEDGMRLYGKLYYGKKDAPMILFFHGYHGMAAWDGYGFFQLCKTNGFHLLMIDERAHGKSEGRAITFGIMERYDCKLWTEYAVKRLGESIDIFLAGVSMGAASVMMSSTLGLPGNVKGIIEDCGYLGPPDIIKETIRSMKLPVKPFYQLIKLGGRLFGHFDLEADTALQSVRKTNIPILFIQGERDSVVPPSMGAELYEACKSQKELVMIKGADHANSAMTDYETYEKEILKFMRESLI